jgi:hypothetical protein
MDRWFGCWLHKPDYFTRPVPQRRGRDLTPRTQRFTKTETRAVFPLCSVVDFV